MHGATIKIMFFFVRFAPKSKRVDEFFDENPKYEVSRKCDGEICPNIHNKTDTTSR
jgi:hypothetical protein